jgi:hypothetical protein
MSVFTNPASGAAEHAAAYVIAVLELLDRDPIAVLREMPSALPRAIMGLSPQQLGQPEQQGKWSIRQILQHLADSEVVWAWRMRLILAQDRPQLTGYDQDLWAERLHYEQADPSDALALFAVLRRANLRLMECVPSRPQKGRRACRARGGKPGASSPALRGARFAAPSADRSGTQRGCLTRVGLVPR